MPLKVIVPAFDSDAISPSNFSAPSVALMNACFNAVSENDSCAVTSPCRVQIQCISVEHCESNLSPSEERIASAMVCRPEIG